jgi:hypothetical protein
MGAADLVIAGLVLAGALYLLYRSTWKRGGACHGCDGGACGRPAASPLVRLERRPGADQPPRRARGATRAGASSS